MLFWIICLVLATVSALMLALPLRPVPGEDEAGRSDVDIYRAQLDELDRDIERGVLDEDEAERARTEIARRLLAADKEGRARLGSAPRGLTLAIVGLSLVTLIGGGLWLYDRLGAPGYGDLPRADRIARSQELLAARPTQAEAEAEMAAMPRAAPQLPPEEMALIEQLRDMVPQRPDELMGWELLARNEQRLQNFAAAAEAQRNVIRIKGADATAEDHALLADLLVSAAGGIVTEETERLASFMLNEAPRDPAALYYLGLANIQIGRPDEAFRFWRALLESSPPETPGMDTVRARIEELAWAAGVDYTPPDGPAPIRGPSLEQMQSAEDMDPEARARMVEGMVAQLNQRLATQGGTAEEWAQLIGALGVLGRTDQARAIWQEAQSRFADRPEDLDRIRGAAQGAGIAG